ncbi:DNA-deoxyinosine glycosylase [Serpentinicella alkaliphila]|uniref:G/U mismatch-specific uracil-DNA glycosylase n=1 Tax=Serpentinicella alkaliphila TaxID=1734049 RepID=A0A4R2TPA7_9FIRM|nr:DNA-deoxyinosine glycosylase [Serpentinicella alkaliphila]QUH24570.1 DNA-deoxyinosine glycosylase [Serpentinicella alkaliphila]TCQ04666.1 G/U mismatch-specific uracil-DNA glycosylase [Serpentinicella alkaliphila]
MDKLKSFEPLINKESKVLILGSMPGVMSLDKQQYYGNPRNHFWKIIYSLFNEIEDEHYEQKKAFLMKKGIALWDVINTCFREGSLDSNIKKEEVNEVESLLEYYPNIRFIGFNGTKAYSTLKKHIGIQFLNKVEYKQLPSTSPIPGRNIKSFDDKLHEWSIILNYL